MGLAAEDDSFRVAELFFHGWLVFEFAEEGIAEAEAVIAELLLDAHVV